MVVVVVLNTVYVWGVGSGRISGGGVYMNNITSTTIPVPSVVSFDLFPPIISK